MFFNSNKHQKSPRSTHKKMTNFVLDHESTSQGQICVKRTMHEKFDNFYHKFGDISKHLVQVRKIPNSKIHLVSSTHSDNNNIIAKYSSPPSQLVIALTFVADW